MYGTSRRLLWAVAVGLPLLAGSRGARAADATVDLTATRQLIRGFGASSAWCGTLSEPIMDSLYTDLGYSILRVRIEENIGDGWSSGNFDAWEPELTNAKNAIARGAIVFASPWNPPNSMKSGGKLMTSKYADYANYLKAYAKYFADNGAPLYAVSIQNEPDYADDWTAWTADDLHKFLTEEGAALSSAFRVMMPESFQFRHPMSDPSLNDATVASYISIVGGHLYGGTIQEYPLATDQGMELWQTEHYFDDDQLSNVMALGKEIHECMVTASMNAYIYWWITWPNGLCESNGNVYKRAYALGQFAKHIRPGYFRVDATATPESNLNVSAYTGDNRVVIVAVNTGNSSANQNFVIRGGTASDIASWQTTSNSNMEAGQAYQAPNGTFTASLPSQSITTFVGSLDGMDGTGGGTSTGGATGSGGDMGVGGAPSVGGSPVIAVGGRSAGGAPGLGGSPVIAVGGRSAGGAPGVGGSAVSGVGGRIGTGGSAPGASGTTTVGAGGSATSGPGGTGTLGGAAGNVGAETATSGGDSSGCGCHVTGSAARGLGGGLGAILALLGLAFTRRRRSAR